jgi:hypothetical protein
MDGFRQDPTVTAIEVDVAMGYFTGLQFVTAQKNSQLTDLNHSVAHCAILITSDQ